MTSHASSYIYPILIYNLRKKIMCITKVYIYAFFINLMWKWGIVLYFMNMVVLINNAVA